MRFCSITANYPPIVWPLLKPKWISDLKGGWNHLSSFLVNGLTAKNKQDLAARKVLMVAVASGSISGLRLPLHRLLQASWTPLLLWEQSWVFHTVESRLVGLENKRWWAWLWAKSWGLPSPHWCQREFCHRLGWGQDFMWWGIYQPGHGCHPVLELKEAANKFAVTEMLQRRQFSVQERDREILSHEGPQVKRLERIKKHNITNKQTPFILHLLTQ